MAATAVSRLVVGRDHGRRTKIGSDCRSQHTLLGHNLINKFDFVTHTRHRHRTLTRTALLLSKAIPHQQYHHAPPCHRFPRFYACGTRWSRPRDDGRKDQRAGTLCEFQATLEPTHAQDAGLEAWQNSGIVLIVVWAQDCNEIRCKRPTCCANGTCGGINTRHPHTPV